MLLSGNVVALCSLAYMGIGVFHHPTPAPCNLSTISVHYKNLRFLSWQLSHYTGPVDHGCQIQEPSPDGNIGNINGPCLVWPVYHRITQEIGTYLGLLHPLRKIHFRINGINVHLIHITPCFASADLISTGFQLRRHLPGTPGGIIRMQMVNDLLTGQFFFRNRRAFIINAGTINTKKPGTNRSGEFFSRQKVLD